MVGNDTPTAADPATEQVAAAAYDEAHRPNARAFIKAWERFREGTFTLELQLERTVTGLPEPLVSAGTIVQAPPQRTVRGFGSQSNVFGDVAQTCEVDSEGNQVCTAAHETESYREAVVREMATFAQYFETERPLYAVSLGTPGCYQLQLNRQSATTPYGTATKFCFDAATGAMTLFERTDDHGTDRAEATNVSSLVDPAAFGGPRDITSQVAPPTTG